MKNFIYLLLIAAIGFTACTSNKHVKEIKAVDSLYTVVDSIEKILSGIDTNKIRLTYKEYSENISLLKSNFKDKKEDSVWSVMTTYGIIKKPLKSFINDFPGFYSEIEFSRHQLDSLKIDINSDNIKADKITEYTKTEAEAVYSLRQQVEISVNTTRERLKLFDSLNPKVIKVIEKLKKEGKGTSSSEASEEEEDD
jgi:DNA polymerase I-like protein with 3'-5' exonuclease and polymerase domains